TVTTATQESSYQSVILTSSGRSNPSIIYQSPQALQSSRSNSNLLSVISADDRDPPLQPAHQQRSHERDHEIDQCGKQVHLHQAPVALRHLRRCAEEIRDREHVDEYVEQRVAVPGLIGAKPAVSTH